MYPANKHKQKHNTPTPSHAENIPEWFLLGNTYSVRFISNIRLFYRLSLIRFLAFEDIKQNVCVYVQCVRRFLAYCFLRLLRVQKTPEVFRLMEHS